MPFVVDASLAAAWFLPDEDSPAATSLARRLSEKPGAVPNLFFHEMRNLLVLACRRNRLSEEMLSYQIDRLGRFPLRDAGGGEAKQIVRLALAHGLTAYDAAYLALAIAERLPLATLDKKLATAAQAENVPVLGPLGASGR
jgi:predicted nucleic acid-binding protein